MLDENLYRIGNCDLLQAVQCQGFKEVDTFERSGIVMVRSNGKETSLMTEERLERERACYTGTYLWKITSRYLQGWPCFADTRETGPGQSPDHYLLCPRSDMPLTKYISLLSKLALQLERVQRL